jgi:hypothetical protein
MAYSQKYLPSHLSRRDRQRWKREMDKSRRLYKRGKYYSRKPVKSYKHRRSPHLAAFKKLYGEELDTKRLARMAKLTGCKRAALEAILSKGRGAYYSSGSRPSQTAESWAVARLASALTGGKSSYVDRVELTEGCRPSSKARKRISKKRPRRTRKR